MVVVVLVVVIVRDAHAIFCGDVCTTKQKPHRKSTVIWLCCLVVVITRRLWRTCFQVWTCHSSSRSRKASGLPPPPPLHLLSIVLNQCQLTTNS